MKINLSVESAIVTISAQLLPAKEWYIFIIKNLRTCPSAESSPKEWDETYKIKINIKKSINHFIDSLCVVNRKTTNEKTLHADLLLAGISQLLTIVVTYKINQRQHILLNIQSLLNI